MSVHGEQGASTGEHERDGGAASEPGEVVSAVRQLVELMGRHGISELDLTFADVAIRLRGTMRSSELAAVVAPPAVAFEAVAPPVSELPTVEPVGHLVTAPMVGTFYSAPSPSDPPFVQIGDRVEVGQTVGIIEAMKIMNEILVDRAGIVVELLVVNGEAVEYGSPLLRVAPHGAAA